MARRSKLIARRKSREWTQQSLAAHLHVHEMTVRRWELGTNPPAPWHRRPLAEALDVTFDELDELLVPDTPHRDPPAVALTASRLPLPSATLSESDDDVDRRTFIAAAVVAAVHLPTSIRDLLGSDGGSISAEQVQAVGTYVDEFRQQDAVHGGDGVLGVAVALHEQVTAWLARGTPPTDLHHALQVVRADLGAQVAWLAFDAGHTAMAQQYLHDTIVNARLIDHPATEVRAMSCMCLLLNRAGRPNEALQSAEAAQRIAQPWATPRLRSLLHLRSAAAHATLGDPKTFAKEIHKAEMQLDRGDHDDDLRWTRFVGPQELAGLAGRSYQVLGRPDIAASTLEAAIGNPDPAHHRNVVWYTVQFAHAVAQQGDATEAATVGLRVLPAVHSLQSGRTRRELRQLRMRLDGYRSTSPRASEFADAYDHS